MRSRLLGAAIALALGANVLAMSTTAAADGDGASARLAPAAATVLLTVGDRRLTGGEVSVVTARLLDATTGQPVAGESLTLQSRRVGTEVWVDGATVATEVSGRAQWPTVTSRHTTRYRVAHAISAQYARTLSDPRTIVAKPTVSASLARDWVRPAGVVPLSGQVAPAYPAGSVLLQRRSDGTWRTVARAEQDENGRFAFPVTGTPGYGAQRYRVLLADRMDRLGDASEIGLLRTARVVTYRIETRGRIVVSLKDFREQADAIYADTRGWSRANVHFKRVRRGGAFSLVLSEASYVPRFSSTCDRFWSCRVGRYVIINQNRWRWGTRYFKASGGTLDDYRAMVVNHETGHWFGLGHATCGGAGRRAPVMMQQSKGLLVDPAEPSLGACEPNAWPLQWEVSRAR